MTRRAPWGDAAPLAGCDVIRPLEPPPSCPSREAAKPAPNPIPAKLRTANRFLDVTARGLRPAEIVVWVMLWRDERGGTARTAVSALARRAGLSVSTVKRALRTLRRGGHVVVVTRGTLNTGPSVYRLWGN
jgi:hypothetical protein